MQYGAGTLQPAESARQAKKPKGSQEAHEAIRPAVSDEGSQQSFRLPRQTGLSGRQLQVRFGRGRERIFRLETTGLAYSRGGRCKSELTI